MTTLENDLEGRKMYHVIILKDRFFVCNLKNTCHTGETLMTRLGNGLERKKMVHFSLWEDVEVLQRELKIEQRAHKWKSAITLEWLI